MPSGQFCKGTELIGCRFGKLVVIDFDSVKVVGHVRKIRKAYWKCQCDCGKQSIVGTGNLTSGCTKSCGCLIHKHSWNYGGFGEISGTYWTKIQRSARERNIKFKLAIEYAWKLFLKQSRKCALTDIPLTLYRNNRKGSAGPFAQTASLDRIDSLQGYVKGNVQWLHKDVNRMKWELTQDEFINVCKLVAQKFS